jgi:phage regulator Rha-like protein
MTYSLPSELIPQVEVIDGVAVTTSRDIAKYFGKEHYNVLRS